MAPPPIPNTPARNPDKAPTAISASPQFDQFGEIQPRNRHLANFFPSRASNGAFLNRASGIPAIGGGGYGCQWLRLQGSCATLIRKDECRFLIGDFRRCTCGFQFVNRITLSRSRKGPRAGPPTAKSRR